MLTLSWWYNRDMLAFLKEIFLSTPKMDNPKESRRTPSPYGSRIISPHRQAQQAQLKKDLESMESEF